MTALRIENFGNGPDIALVHGWGIGPRAWETLVARLANICRIHLVSLPGYGTPAERMDKQPTTGMPEEAHEYCIADYGNLKSNIHALSKALPAGCTLCGWSLGAQLAMQAALDAPGHFARLILVGGTPRFTQTGQWPHAQPPALLDTFDAAVAADPTTALQRFAALLNQGDTQARACTRSLTQGMTQLPDRAALTQGLRWLREVDLRDAVAALTLPVLLIHGEHDPLMPLAAAQWLNTTLPDSRLEVFSGAAHAPFLNNPERFVSLLTHAALN